MINSTTRSGKNTYGVNSYVADTESDVSSLPINCGPGSSCLVVATGNIYILNSTKQWILLKQGGSSSESTGSGTYVTWQPF